MELWDLEKKNMLDPFATISSPIEAPLPPKTMVKFASTDPVILAGDTAGDISVFRLNGKNFKIKIKFFRI